MTDTLPAFEIQNASDGYPIQTAIWRVPEGDSTIGRILVLHGVQSHQGWYQRLGRNLANAGFEAHFPDRRGSGANTLDRGDVPSAKRFIDDVAEPLQRLRDRRDNLPLTLAGISWGGKIALVTAARFPALVDQIALICPGLHPRVDVSRLERFQIAWAFLTKRRKEFPIPLSDPALFTKSAEGQAFIAADPLALRSASAKLLAASFFLDRMVRRARSAHFKPILLILGGDDRIVDNAKTLSFVNRLDAESRTVIEYPDGDHTLEFGNDPDRYAHDLVDWMKGSSRLK